MERGLGTKNEGKKRGKNSAGGGGFEEDKLNQLTQEENGEDEKIGHVENVIFDISDLEGLGIMEEVDGGGWDDISQHSIGDEVTKFDDKNEEFIKRPSVEPPAHFFKPYLILVGSSCFDKEKHKEPESVIKNNPKGEPSSLFVCQERHSVVHSYFPCPSCGKILATKTTLNRHLKGHSDQRPFSCDQCLRSFVQKSELSRHLLIHTGERPFRCALCKKTFRQKAHLKRHLKTYHKQPNDAAKTIANG